jgi:PAS domain S-box-containing protein
MVTLIMIVACMVTASVDRRASAGVQQLNQELERRVAERTLELESVNQALRKEIAERERAEEGVRRSEDRLRLVIDTISHQIWSGPPDGSLDFCNAQWLSYMGFTQEEAQGEGWQRMLHPDDRERVLKAWRDSVANGTPYEQEERHRRADGQYRWFLSRGVPLRDSEGRIIRWYGTNTDIEDRKNAEDELRKQKEVFQKIFENIPVMTVLVGQNGRHELVNREWERTIGWTLAEIQEQNLDIYAEAFPDPQYRQMVRDMIAASTGKWTDFKVRVRNGRVIDANAAFVRLSDGSTLAIGRDITEQKRTEEALQEAQHKLAHVTRTQAMGELAAAIAHEVNQPLTAIVTNANFSLRQLKGSTANLDELRTAITEIVNDATRASAVISRIRGLLVKGSPRQTELDINRIVQEVITLLRNELSRNHITLRTDLASNLPPVPGDPVQLQQVLINLVVNAIEAMRTSTDRPRELRISVEKSPDSILVQVHDSGPGIKPELADRIFEPFFTTKAEGIGMGLSISRSIIESHGGHLSIAPASRGAVFQFTLPVDHNDAA